MALSVQTIDRIGMAAVAATVVVCLAGGGGAALRMHRHVQMQSERTRQAAQDRAAVRTAVDALQRTLTETRREYAALRALIPESGHSDEFHRRLMVLLQERHVVRCALEPQAPVQEGARVRLPVRIACSGTFVDLQRLLYDLETLDRVTTLDSLTLTRPNPADPCQVDIRLSAYERKRTAAPAAPPDVTAGLPGTNLALAAHAPYQPASRDLFAPPGQSPAPPGPVATGNQSPATAAPSEYRLKAVMSGRGGTIARVNDALVRQGERLGRYTVDTITRDTVVLKAGAETVVLRIAE